MERYTDKNLGFSVDYLADWEVTYPDPDTVRLFVKKEETRFEVQVFPIESWITPEWIQTRLKNQSDLIPGFSTGEPEVTEVGGLEAVRVIIEGKKLGVLPLWLVGVGCVFRQGICNHCHRSKNGLGTV